MFLKSIFLFLIGTLFTGSLNTVFLFSIIQSVPITACSNSVPGAANASTQIIDFFTRSLQYLYKGQGCRNEIKTAILD